jgi:hypothetical protein
LGVIEKKPKLENQGVVMGKGYWQARKKEVPSGTPSVQRKGGDPQPVQERPRLSIVEEMRQNAARFAREQESRRNVLVVLSDADETYRSELTA